jgi:hypothetical protein
MSTNTNTNTNKYRPYLSGNAIKYLKQHASVRLANEILGKEDESILTEIYVACMKLELSMLKDTNPAYTPSSTPRVSITDQLGISQELISDSISDSVKLSRMSKEDADKVVKDYEAELMKDLLNPGEPT